MRSLLVCLGLAVYATGADRLLLSENWFLQSSTKVRQPGAVLSGPNCRLTGWYPVKVPCTVLAALVDNGVYADPYYGLNLKKIPGFQEGRWLVMPQNSPFRSSWWYRTEFEIPADFRGRYLRLHLDGINYQANVWLNGHRIADAAQVIGMFRRFEFPIAEQARPGSKNYLAIEIIPPGLLPLRTYGTKQIQATTGWDDHNPQPPDMNMGIWREVYITASGPVIIRHPYVASKVALPSLAFAELKISAELTNLSAREVIAELRGEIEATHFAQTVRLTAGETRLVRFTAESFPQLRIRRPRLWWPHPVGPQELYRLRLRVAVQGRLSDSTELSFGIRDATTYLNEEGWRQYTINGRKILVRGAAWMTPDMLLRLSRPRYQALIRYAREACLNMLRSEGFSIRETDEFYDLCDRYGVMVTQQLFGRSIPDEALAIACVKDTILRIRNHPSLVHFLGHDETFPTPSLDKAYRQLIAEYTPERSYQPHSGAFDVKDRFQTGGTRTGTRQLWTYATPSHYYRNKESGAWGFAQSGGIGATVVPLESMRRMLPASELWPPFTEAWSFHTVIQGGRYFDAFLKAMESRYGKPADIADFAMKAQAMNYESARGMYEAYARNKYSATGITAWKFNTAWPASPTWQYIDWYLMAGGAYYGAKKACEPLHIQYSYDDYSVWVVNSYYRGFSGLRAKARVLDLQLKERYVEEAAVEVAPDGKTRLFTVRWPADISRTFFLSLKLSDGAGRVLSDNFYWLSTEPEIPGGQGSRGGVFYIDSKSHPDYTALAALPPARLRVTARFERQEDEILGRVVLENPGSHLAFLIRAAISKGEAGQEVTPCYWEDNYFSLLPGERRELAVSFPTAELAGAAPVVRAAAWPAYGP